MICIAETDARPLYEQVYAAVREEIACGALVQGAALPPIRKLADELRVSRNTVSHAYQQLVSEGYIRAERGSGYFVDCPAETGRAQPPAPAAPPAAAPRPACDFRWEDGSAPGFPWAKWRRYVQDALLQEECRGADPAAADAALRESLCRYLQTGRGVRCTPGQIIVCGSMADALRAVLSCLPAQPCRLAFEQPGSSDARRVFERAGMQVCPAGVQADGIDMAAVRRAGCSLLYVTPSHQFPTGVVTPPEKRRDILRWAEQTGGFVIENDYDSEFSYGARRLPALQAMDEGGRVIYLGTLDKALGTAMRCAYAVLPAPLLPQEGDRSPALPSYHEAALAAFLRDGLLERQARTAAACSRDKHEILRGCLRQEGQGLALPAGQPAGTHILLRIPRCTDQQALLAWLRANGVALYGAKDCWAAPAQAREDLFLLGFAAIPASGLRQAMHRLLGLLQVYFGDCTH